MLVGAVLRRDAALVATVAVAVVSAFVIVPSGISAAAFSCAGDGATYQVESGDSWYRIADDVDVGVTALLDANEAESDDLLVAGDRLCLPAGADVSDVCASTYTVRSGDSWIAIGRRAGVSATAVAGANGVGLGHTIHPGDVVCLPEGATIAASAGSSGSSSGGASYTVARGDSWAAIAWRADVSMRSLLNANDASSSDVIMPGDVLRLPAGAKQPESDPASLVELQAAPTQGPCGYGDTWGHARSSGRTHLGTDIFSGSGNYVYAVVDGTLTERLWDGVSVRAGNGWTLTGADGSKYFYAHLSDFAPDLRVGSRVRAGQIIGWVGSTGNSSAPHLHFEVRPGGGTPVNPYPILRAQGACNSGRPYVQPGGWIPERKR